MLRILFGNPADLIIHEPEMGDLYLGSVYSLNPDFIRRKNITVIISMIHVPDVPATLHYTYYIEDSSDPSVRLKMSRMLPEITALIHSHRKAGMNVLVHCQAGIHRGPTVVAGYLKRYKGCSTKEAVGLIKGARPIADPWLL